MTVLITGGGGFIANYCVQKLIAQGEKVVALDVNPPSYKMPEKNYTFVRGSVAELADILNAVHDHQVDKIIHLAYLLTTEAAADPVMGIKVNVVGTSNVFQAARLFNISRVVHTSTLGVFSGNQDLYGGKPVVEDDPRSPATFYGSCKYCNEMEAEIYRNKYNVPVHILRLGIVTGLGRKTGLTTWASDYAAKPAMGEPVTLPMPSEQKLLLTNVEFVAECLVTICQAKEVKHVIYNCPSMYTSAKEIKELVTKHIPDAKISFNEEAPPTPFISIWDASRFEKEFNKKSESMEYYIKKDIEAIRKNA